jgi:hypothetical protein
VPAWAAETREKVSAAQPAAPEPSGFEAWPDDAVALWQDAKNECNAAHLAKEAAESQLAAMRRVVEDYGDDVPEKAIYLIRLQLDMSRTPAPSPGVERCGCGSLIRGGLCVRTGNKPVPSPGAGQEGGK